MRVNVRNAALAVLSLSIAAQTGCGADTGVAASSGLDAPDRPAAIGFDSLFTVGAIDGEPWETFGAVTQVAFDGAGTLYVFDPQNSRITVVGLDGELVREVGKKGAGPGEFQQPLRMAVAPDGTIAVADLGVAGVTLFDPQGEFIRSVRLDPENGLPATTLIMHPTERAIVTQGRGLVLRAGRPRPDGEPAQPTSVPIRKISLPAAEEVVVYDAWLAPQPERDAERIEGSGGGGGRVSIQFRADVAFQPPVHLGMLMDGRYLVADSSTYTIDVLAPDGTIQQTLRRPIEPTVVNDAIKEKEKARRRVALEERSASGPPRIVAFGGGAGGAQLGGDMARQFLDAQRNQIESLLFADVIPVIAGIGVEWSGRLWVERSPAELGENGPIDLIDTDGNYHGTIQPDGPRIPAAFGPDGLVAYIEKDEYDVPTVRVMRLRVEAAG